MESLYKNNAIKKNKYDLIMVDVGNVLFYDFPIEVAFSYFAFYELKKISHITEIKFLQHRNELLNKSKIKWVETLCEIVCKEDSKAIISRSWNSVLDIFESISLPIEGAIDRLIELSKSNYLVVAANQPIEIINVLRKYNIHDCFKNIYIDSMMNISKPSLKFYKHILTKENIKQGNVLMIGDRLDNDILPASLLGLDTAWINCNYKLREIPIIPHYWQIIFAKYYIDINQIDIQKNISKKVKITYQTNALKNLQIGHNMFNEF